MHTKLSKVEDLADSKRMQFNKDKYNVLYTGKENQSKIEDGGKLSRMQCY